MHRQANYIVLGLVALLALVLLNLPGKAAGGLKLALGGLFLPLFGLAGSAQGAVERMSPEVLSRRNLLNEVSRLRRENDELRMRSLHDEGLDRENRVLRQQVGWAPRSVWKRKLARVVARDPANWWRTVQIDLGTREGVSTNSIVLSSEGLVGRVVIAGESRSQVALVGDPNCRFSAMVRETRDVGIVMSGSGGLGDQQSVYLTYLLSSSALTNGQSVITSGLGGVFPKDIPVGRIFDFRSVGNDTYLEAQVRLNVNLNHLEEVWVLIQ